MGIYNCADTLGEAIESILNQTYTCWELIMCDDGSSDDTLAVAEMYKHDNPTKIIVLKNETNLGLNKTLNKCLRVATGEYIARMDGDDISLPNRFEEEIDFLEKHFQYGLVSCPMIFFDSDGQERIGKAKERPEKKDLLKGGAFCHAPCMIRKNIFLEVNGYTEDERLLRVEDFNLWQKIYARGYVGYNLQKPLYKMRDDQKAYSRRSFRSRLNGTYAVALGVGILQLPVYYYIYVVRDFVMNVIKSLLPSGVYRYFHKKNKAKV